MPSFGAGTAPRIMSRFFFASTRTTSTLRTVTCSLPMRPAMRRPLMTWPG
jgi:hypothetical protein